MFQACLGQEESAGNFAPAKPEAVLFEAMPMVEAASLHTQTLVEAPASVTVITAEDIWRRGYRTLAEVLADVRGFYVTYDRAYQFVGVRGISVPGDYNTRFLVMINGHTLSENIFASAGYFGQDFGLELDLIERIEIIRGPSSALYGSNGMLATVNIVTRSPVDVEALRVSAETSNFGERKGEVSASKYLGRGANLLVSVSLFNNTGQSLYFPEFDTPETNYGWAIHMDGEKGYHTFANLIWHSWSFLAYFNAREKEVPTAWYGTDFNRRGTDVVDGRGFFESSYERDLGTNAKLRWRIYYDRYRYAGRYAYTGDDGEALDQRDGAAGDWLGSQLTYRFRVRGLGDLTVGAEASWDLRASQLYYQVSPAYENFMRIDRLNRSGAGFVQQEWDLSRRWKLYLGGRLDGSRFEGPSLSPRIALIYQPSAASALKFLYGRAFSNPTSYEQFYDDGISQVPSPSLRPEHMENLEVALEKQVGKRLELSANVYRYWLSDLIEAIPITDQVQQYQNIAQMTAAGAEFEARGQLGSRLRADASLALQTSKFDPSQTAINSPARIVKLLLDVPLHDGRLSLSGGFQYLSERATLAGNFVPPVYLVNLALASRSWMPGGVEIQAGIHNLFNRRYWDPVGPAEQMDIVQQDGRSFFVRLSWGSQFDRQTRGLNAASTTSGAGGKP